jgi:membrane protease YdiL (CAAX protease family)
VPVFSNIIIILIVVLALAYYFVPAAMRKHIGTALLLSCSIHVGAFFVQVFKGQARPASVEAMVAEERADLTLRMMTTINVGVTKMFEATGGLSILDGGEKKAQKNANKSVIEISSENLGPFFEQSSNALDEAIKLNPKSAELKAKDAILAEVSRGKKKQAKEVRQRCRELMNSSDEDARRLGLVLKYALIEHKAIRPNSILPSPENAKEEQAEKKSDNTKNQATGSPDSGNLDSSKAHNQSAESQIDSGKASETKETINNRISSSDAIAIIEKGISKGWYRDNAKILYYKASDNKAALDKLSKSLENHYYEKFRFMIVAYSIGALCAFIGLVTIVIHFGSLGRRDPKGIPPEERVGIDLDLRTIYCVFVGWLSIELMMSQLFKLLPKDMFHMGSNPVGIAAFSLFSYVITMIPALLLIHFIAFKPRGLKLMEALKLRLKTPTTGPFKMILAGFLSWCSIIPMVLISALIASKFLNSQGSDNPVLSQISMVANSNNFLAVALLYFTVAAAAPFFEEIIFRGFLYGSLKTRLGIFPAILISAFVFAFIHFDKGGALMLFALGPVLAVSYERTRSLLPPMIAHGLWNGGSFAMAASLYYS